MNRRQALKTIAAAFALQQSRLFAQGNLKIEPLAGKLSILTGAGGNILVRDSPDGLLVVDTGVPEAAEGVGAKISSVSKAPITTIINTHWHGDHTGGNPYLAKGGAKIIAHGNTAKHLERVEHITFLKQETKPLPPEGRPKEILKESGDLSHANSKLHYQHMAPAHTDGDTILHFKDENVLHGGDLLFIGLYPFIDYSTGGNIEGMITASDGIYRLADSKTRIVPGHGPVCGKAEVKELHDMLVGVNHEIDSRLKQGKDLAAIQADQPTKQWDEKWGKQFLKPPEFVRMIVEGKSQKA